MDTTNIHNFNDFLNWLLGNVDLQTQNQTPFAWFKEALPYIVLIVIAILIFKK